MDTFTVQHTVVNLEGSDGHLHCTTHSGKDGESRESFVHLVFHCSPHYRMKHIYKYLIKHFNVSTEIKISLKSVQF